MRRTKQMSITLPLAMAAVVEAKVASGEYASDSEVIRDGLRVLVARDKVVERWLNGVVVPTYDRVMAGQERSYTGCETKEYLRAQDSAPA